MSTAATGDDCLMGSQEIPPYASLLEKLLVEQQSLTAVEQFARVHDSLRSATGSSVYSSLLPTSPPAEGQQLAFEVDLDRCSGCKACVTACHNLNGLDERETWRDVGLLVGGTTSLPVLQHVTTACHHCIEPACLAACPVNAYEKDPVTGIVKHLDDQCFGCQYCTLACPYDVPKYQPQKGIVRKCDMCSSRLAVGEAPACVQACPNQAIAIRVVDVKSVIEEAEAAIFLPAAPHPQITYPTTSFKSQRVFPRNMLPVDYLQANPQHPHWPLVVMLVLTQLSVGAFAVDTFSQHLFNGPVAEVQPMQVATALALGLLALGASVLHLGRPQFAFRAVLGLRHSWLSREIIAFGLFAGCACVYATTVAMFSRYRWTAEILPWLSWAVVLIGGAALFCSVMIYATVHRELWEFSRTVARFGLTSALLGLATFLATVSALSTVWPTSLHTELVLTVGPALCWSLIFVCGLKLLHEVMLFRHLLGRSMTPLKRSALLMTRDLGRASTARFSFGLLGGIVGPSFLLKHFAVMNELNAQPELAAAALLTFGASLAGELLERYLFFAAVAGPRMPGGIR